jgi:hypothetical protein
MLNIVGTLRFVQRSGVTAMAFLVFTVFVVCLIVASLLMYLTGVVLDTVRGSRGAPAGAGLEADLSTVRVEVLVPRPREPAAAGYVAPTFYLCR